jgi:hypothetical protein
MNPISSLSRCCRAFVAILITLLAGWTAPAAAQTAAPYVFFLVDTSGSMNFSPPCTQTQIDAGACGYLCPTGDCFVPLQGDDPASRMYQIKEGLYNSIAQRDDLLFGFASFNQDTLGVRAKHWMYQATSNGPSIGTWGPFPATGARELFGLTWACDTGSNDNEIGCYPASPADLNDPWELTRVQRLPKGSSTSNTGINVYIRYAGITYRVFYALTSTAAPPASSIQTTVTTYRCTNAGCTTTSLVGSQTVSWSLVSEFLSWDNASSTNTVRTNPTINYFTLAAAGDMSASNTCSGWDPNTDSTADRYPNSTGYSLRWPTDSSDPRGSSFSVGDVIPLDWSSNHKTGIVNRLAPNLALDSTATPDFRTSIYLNDTRQGFDTFLRLKNESARPLIAYGSSPLYFSLTTFRTWYSGCSATTCGTVGGWLAVAMNQDPDWANRHVALVLITDGDDTCSGDPCARAQSLLDQYGVRTFVVAYGVQPGAPNNKAACIASAGGTGTPYYPQTPQEMADDLALVYAAAANP